MTAIRDFSADFHREPDTSYLNCAYHGAIPHVAVAAMNEAAALKQAPYRLPDVAHFEFPATYRTTLARFLGSDPRQVVIGDSATHGIMLLVNGLRWESGDELIHAAGEFPANRFPWESLQARGVTLHQVDFSAAAWREECERLMTPRTRLVSVSWVSYSTGFRVDLQELSRLCRSHGALLVVDASQAIGGLPFQSGDFEFDLMACATYKWLLGPYGLGFSLIGSDLLQQLTTPNVHWMRVKGAEDFNRLDECDLDLVEDASRFDVNETANFFNLAAGTASLRYLQDIGLETIVAHDAALVQRILDGLPGDVVLRSSADHRHRSNIVALRGRDAAHTQQLFDRLQAARVFVSLRDGNLRISPHVYNTAADVDRLLEILNARSWHVV
jgi:selenocysteine lyase/cysteine desulfurase